MPWILDRRIPRLFVWLAAAALMALGPAVMAQDADSDGVPDELDNCVNTFNPLQVDADGDATGNVCDCAPREDSDAALLGPAGELTFQSGSDLAWSAPRDGGPVAYDLLRGSTMNLTSATCLESDEVDLVAIDGTVPAVGELFLYVIRAQSSCGGNLGADHLETRRPGANCPSGLLLGTCTEAMDVTCPNTAPICAGVSFNGGVGCFREFLGNCYDTGLRSYKVTEAQPLTINFADDVTSLGAFFSHEVSTVAGTMRFFDADNLEISSSVGSDGPCSTEPMPPAQIIDFDRPTRRIEITASGPGDLWIDTLTVNPNAPIPTCTENMDLSCPNTSPVCAGVTFTGGLGCLREFLGACYDTGRFSYKVTQTAPLIVHFAGGVTTLDVFFAHETDGTTGSMRFFDGNDVLVDSISSLGPCAGGPMPPRQSLTFSASVRRIEITAQGPGDVWIDSFTVNP